jgi:hypothetical protein
VDTNTLSVGDAEAMQKEGKEISSESPSKVSIKIMRVNKLVKATLTVLMNNSHLRSSQGESKENTG